MERIFAFTDEYGAFGWDIENPSVSTHFIITAIIVRESNVDAVRNQAEVVRKKHFQTGEMKSSKIGKNHDRRKRILADLLPLPFTIFSVVFDKKELKDWKGLSYKPSFYKFMNNIVHKELRRAYSHLTILADEIGDNDYMSSFVKYVDEKQDIPNLLGETEFSFQTSHGDVLVQIADLISGTLAYKYDTHKVNDTSPDYVHLLNKKISRIEIYPKSYSNYILDNSALAVEYNKEVAEICFKQVVTYIEQNKESEDIETEARILTVKYLLFRFMNNDTRGYISTKELKNQLSTSQLGEISTQSFRTKIIGHLRDAGVIVASSSKGYKIPSRYSELYDFINHGTSIIIPMLERLKKCRDIIKLGTTNELDLFDHTEYKTLKDYFDN